MKKGKASTTRTRYKHTSGSMLANSQTKPNFETAPNNSISGAGWAKEFSGVVTMVNNAELPDAPFVLMSSIKWHDDDEEDDDDYDNVVVVVVVDDDA